jgi:hypothetical protein
MNNESTKHTYTIENLIETFGKHHEELLKDRKEMERKVSRGEIEFQEWMKDSFSICLALHNICKEIKMIKEKLNERSFAE